MEKAVSHRQAVHANLSNPSMRAALRQSLHLIWQGRQKTLQHFTAWEKLRDEAYAVKQYALEHLPQLLEQFEKQARKNGMQVHYASNAADACATVYDIIKAHDVKLVVKGKSMVSEEIELGAYLKARGVELKASDVGDLVVYLTGEPPVHILGPAMHYDRYQIGRIFAKHLHVPEEHDVHKLNAFARNNLRQDFYGLKLGLSGVNFAAAKEGALWLIENEGNGRMCTTAPDVHVAICGIEKLTASLDDAAVLAQIVGPSANAQYSPAYGNIITGPRRVGELDGPREVHVILLDNGRSQMLADPDFYAALRCIRCSACMNMCPVFDKIGGHAYLTTYPGPIGTVISPLMDNFIRQGHLLSLCSQCKRCAQMCPVKIPLPQLILKLRARLNQESEHPTVTPQPFRRRAQKIIFKLFTKAAVNPTLWHTLMNKSYAANFLLQLFGKFVPPTAAWSRYRQLPQLSNKLERELTQLKGITIE